MIQLPTEKHQTPLHPLIIHTDKEFRVELPFNSETSSLYYLGVNVQENWFTEMHYHDHFELCYLDNGQGQYKIDKTLYEVNQGELLLTRPRESHFGLAGKQAPFKLYYIGFKLDRMISLQADFYNLGLNRIVKDQNGAVKSIFEQMINEVQLKPSYCNPMVEGLFLQLLATVLRMLNDPEVVVITPPKLLNGIIIEVMNRLHKEIRYDHDIKLLAKSISISRSHLAREFKQAIGIPIGKYMCNLCLDKAKFELRETDKSVTQIAEELFFSSIHSFSIFFKKFTKRSPTEFRKLYTTRG